jgi:hypothetical protein
MQTIEAIYDHGNIIFLGKPPASKSKITITFVEEIIEKGNKVKFPVGNLGKIKNTNSGDLYEEYLSDRY